MKSNADPRPGADSLNVAATVLIGIVFAALRWLKLNSLVWGDPPMWLLQLRRAALGELPYRDFAWNYPPFTLWFFAPYLRMTGISFTAVQLALDALSLAIVLLSYALLKHFLPSRLRVPVLLALMAIGATAQTKFTLFSLLTYSPSLHFATIGLLLLLLGALRYRPLLIVTGAFIAETSKPEALLAAVIVVAIVAGVRRKPLLFVASTVPAIAAYTVEAWRVGFQNFAAGMGGYGLATFACPWWPTGLGLYGAAASIAQAFLIAGLASLLLTRQYRKLQASIVPCALLYLSYYWYLNRDILSSPIGVKAKILQVAPLLLWTSPVLLPVMWFSICYWCYLVLKKRSQLDLILLLTVPVVMSVRSLFGSTLFPVTEVSAVCYAFFILIGPILLWRFLDQAAPGSWKSVAIVAGILLVYSGLRIVGAYATLLSGKPYTMLQTNAGIVRLADHDGSAEAYQYVIANTGPQDAVFDLPYGGGINFAAGRPTATFSTMFQQLRPAVHFQQLDLERLEQAKAKVVLANDEPNYYTIFGHRGNMNCSCPRLVWAPDELSEDTGHVFPVVRYLQENYRVDRKLGMKLVLVPK